MITAVAYILTVCLAVSPCVSHNSHRCDTAYISGRVFSDRIKSVDKGQPLFISDAIIDDYADNTVDTLHKKVAHIRGALYVLLMPPLEQNLLSLGEDRYLTTLLLKHFPNYKTKFTGDAIAVTAAPEKWSVLLSQRRRW